MDSDFAKLVESLDPKFQTLRSMTPVTYAALPKDMPIRGIYLFSDGDEHLYVGRTNDIRRRLGWHCRPGSTHNQATFAFRIARQATGKLKASYAVKGSRADLVKDALFADAFATAKRRLAAMSIRFVEEGDPTRQALLEIYAATVLKTPFNDFENH
ncbi:MAG: GIY-YIG nuclease family protein [Polyangiales bacterium]